MTTGVAAEAEASAMIAAAPLAVVAAAAQAQAQAAHLVGVQLLAAAVVLVQPPAHLVPMVTARRVAAAMIAALVAAVVAMMTAEVPRWMSVRRSLAG